MGRKKKIESIENKTIKLENNKKKNYNVSEGFYYILGLVLALVLIFATDELLSTVNYLFVVIFSIIAVIRVINFVMDKEYLKKEYIAKIKEAITEVNKLKDIDKINNNFTESEYIAKSYISEVDPSTWELTIN